MQRESGHRLRQAHSSILPDTPQGNDTAFFLRSDDSARTVASGQALFSGM
jgi:hypothetical protein